MPPIFKTDKENRLIISDNNETFSSEGLFAIDPQNNLIFYLNEPQPWHRKFNLSERIVFTGIWKINDNYDLELELQETDNSPENGTLVLKGNIISLEGNTIVFELKTVDKNGSSSFRVISLSGELNIDGSNQLFFSVAKKEFPDILLFGSGWRINKNQQITYTYQKTLLKTKTKIVSKLTISGFWEISGANQLSYVLSTGTDCLFDFRAALQTSNMYPKEGVIKYRVGVGVREGRKEKTKIVSLFGTWKISRDLGISFEMEYEKGIIRTLEFEAEITVDKFNRVAIKVRGLNKEDFGISVIFTHKLIKKLDAEVFLRLKKSLKESGVDAGILFPF